MKRVLNKFFVYGTLKIGGRFATYFDVVRKSSVKGILTNHVLYNFNLFPGIIEGDGNVIGELHEYDEPKQVLMIMDDIEGFHNNSETDLYKRKTTTILTENDEQVLAWVYIYNQKLPKSSEKILSGEWVI